MMWRNNRLRNFAAAVSRLAKATISFVFSWIAVRLAVMADYLIHKSEEWEP